MKPALLAGALLGALGVRDVLAQELEPRRWTHLPVGTDVAAVGYLYSDGELDVDPVLRIDDAEVRVHTVLAGYSRYFGLADLTARLDAQVPLQVGRWEGLLNGEPTTVRRDGLADPRIRLSLSFLGAPALEEEAFREYRRGREDGTVAGAALALRVPLGEYDDDQLINLGENRFSFEPQLGVVQSLGPWSFELTGSAYVYAANDDFFGDRRLEQDPLYALQVHVVRSFEPGLWVSAGAAYGRGAETEIDGQRQDDERGNLLYGISAGFSAAATQSFRVGYLRQEALEEVGVDAHNVLVTWAIVF